MSTYSGEAMTCSPNRRKLATQNKPNTTSEHVVPSTSIWIWSTYLWIATSAPLHQASVLV